MSREEYVELVQELCDELELGDAAELLERGLLQVDDTLVGVEYLEERDEVRLLADLGGIEGDVDRSAMLELLLEANLGNTSFCLPTFSLHSDTGHPVVAYHLPLDALLEEEVDLVYVLKELLIPMLGEWKTTMRNVLEDDEPDPPRSPDPGTLA